MAENSPVYTIQKQVHIANRVTPVLFNLLSENIYKKMRELKDSNYDTDGNLVPVTDLDERKRWRYPYFILDVGDRSIGNVDAQGGRYPYLFSNLNTSPGKYNFFLPISNDNVLKVGEGLEEKEVIQTNEAYIGYKSATRVVAGVTVDEYKPVPAGLLYFNLLLNPDSQKVLLEGRSEREAELMQASPVASGNPLRAIGLRSVFALYCSVIGNGATISNKDFTTNDIFLVNEATFGISGTGQRAFPLAGGIFPYNDETRERLFRTHIFPRLKTFFDKGLDWRKAREELDLVYEGEEKNSDEYKDLEKKLHQLQVGPVPREVLGLLEVFLNNEENIPIMMEKLSEIFNQTRFDVTTGEVRGSGGAGVSSSKKAAIILDALEAPSYYGMANSEDKSTVNIFEFLGFANAIEEAGGDGDDAQPYDPQALVASLASSELGLLGTFYTMKNRLGGEPQMDTLRVQEKLQCFLTSGLLFSTATTSKTAGWDNYWNIPDPSDSSKSISPLSGKFVPLSEQEKKKREKEGESTDGWEGHNRIYPVTTNFDSRDFMNTAFIGQDTRDIFPRISKDMLGTTKTVGEGDEATTTQVGKGEDYNQMFKQLWWVYESDGDLKEVQLFLSSMDVSNQESLSTSGFESALEILNSEVLSTAEKTFKVKQLELGIENPTLESIYSKLQEIQTDIEKKFKDGNNNEYYYLDQIVIDFKGTMPSTARNDVTVEFQFNLSSMSALDLKMTPEGVEYPVRLYDLIVLPQTSKISKGFGSNESAQFNPDYSRVRLKVAAKNDYSSNLIIDLNTIDYNFNRTGASGETSMTVNMRGYFETILHMPENDVLTNENQRQAREEAAKKTKEAVDALNNAPEDSSADATDALKKAVEAAEENERKVTVKQRRDASTIMTNLSAKNLLHAVQIKNSKAIEELSAADIEITQNFVKSVVYGDDIVDGSRFFFFGDLIYVLLDAIYKEGTSEHRAATKNMNMRYIVAPIQVPRRDENGKIEYITINPLCIPISQDFFIAWYNDVIIKKNVSNYRIGIFIRDLIERLVNKIIYETCFTAEQTLISPPQIRDTFVATSESEWYIKDKTYFFSPSDPYYEDPVNSKPIPEKPFLRKSMFYDDATQKNSNRNNSDIERDLIQKNYCLIYPSYVEAIKGLTQVKKVDEKDTLKRQKFTPEIFYGRKNTNYNFITNMSLSKTNTPFLREARYSSTNYGPLSLLSNVYDLSFSFVSKGANTILYPGVIINFILLDWGKRDFVSQTPYEVLDNTSGDYTAAFGESNPHDYTTRAHLLGMGGYFIISSVQYILGQTTQDFEIKISAKFNGMDGQNTKRSNYLPAARASDESSGEGEEHLKGGKNPTDETSGGSPNGGNASEDGVQNPPVTEVDVAAGLSPENLAIIGGAIKEKNYIKNYVPYSGTISFESTQTGVYPEPPAQAPAILNEILIDESKSLDDDAINNLFIRDILDELKLPVQTFILKGLDTTTESSGESVGTAFYLECDPNAGTCVLKYLK